MGENNELITMAGTAESMPATSIHSASRREMWMPKWRLVMDHHANTGVENPMSQAGNTTATAKRTVSTVAPKTVSGSRQAVETPTPNTNNSQR